MARALGRRHVSAVSPGLTVPVPVRYQLAFDAGLARVVLRVFFRTVFGKAASRPRLFRLNGTKSSSGHCAGLRIGANS